MRIKLEKTFRKAKHLSYRDEDVYTTFIFNDDEDTLLSINNSLPTIPLILFFLHFVKNSYVPNKLVSVIAVSYSTSWNLSDYIEPACILFYLNSLNGL